MSYNYIIYCKQYGKYILHNDMGNAGVDWDGNVSIIGVNNWKRCEYVSNTPT